MLLVSLVVIIHCFIIPSKSDWKCSKETKECVCDSDMCRMVGQQHYVQYVCTNTSKSCTVNCDDKYSCSNANFYMTPTQNIQIICKGNYSCFNSNIYCGGNMTLCDIKIHNNGMINGYIKCDDNVSKCNIDIASTPKHNPMVTNNIIFECNHHIQCKLNGLNLKNKRYLLDTNSTTTTSTTSKSDSAALEIPNFSVIEYVVIAISLIFCLGTFAVFIVICYCQRLKRQALKRFRAAQQIRKTQQIQSLQNSATSNLNSSSNSNSNSSAPSDTTVVYSNITQTITQSPTFPEQQNIKSIDIHRKNNIELIERADPLPPPPPPPPLPTPSIPPPPPPPPPIVEHNKSMTNVSYYNTGRNNNFPPKRTASISYHSLAKSQNINDIIAESNGHHSQTSKDGCHQHVYYLNIADGTNAYPYHTNSLQIPHSHQKNTGSNGSSSSLTSVTSTVTNMYNSTSSTPISHTAFSSSTSGSSSTSSPTSSSSTSSSDSSGSSSSNSSSTSSSSCSSCCSLSSCSCSSSESESESETCDKSADKSEKINMYICEDIYGVKSGRNVKMKQRDTRGNVNRPGFTVKIDNIINNQRKYQGSNAVNPVLGDIIGIESNKMQNQRTENSYISLSDTPQPQIIQKPYID